MRITKKLSKIDKENFSYPSDYERWLKDVYGISDLHKIQQRYKTVSEDIRRSYEKSSFWTNFLTIKDEFAFDYHKKK